LVLSDIHDNIGNVRLLRNQEDNNFDALIVAGDIGDTIAQEFFEVTDSFACPAYCVYGNWDNSLEYRPTLSRYARLIHHNIEQVGDLYLTGFSGCPSGWGNNPAFLSEISLVESRHQAILDELAKAQKAARQYERAGVEVGWKARRIILGVEGGKREPRRRLNQDEKALRRLNSEIRKTMASKAYGHYLKDCGRAYGNVLTENRRQLLDLIRTRGVSEDRLVVVTHQRLYKLADDGLNPLLHVFGHVHEYAFHRFKATYYLNAAAMDNGLSEFFGRQKIYPEGYCRVTVQGNDIQVERRLLPVTT
jgi:predicted phosphodiesterase